MASPHIITPQCGRSVLISIDGSENSKFAFHWYLKWSRRPNDVVTFFHVFEAPSLPSFSLTNPSSIPTEEWGRILTSKIDETKKIEEDYLADGQGAGLKCEFLSISSDKVGEAIVKQAEKQGAHLIVMGTRGLGPIKRTFLGSVSDYVVHQGVIPVTIVPKL